MSKILVQVTSSSSFLFHSATPMVRRREKKGGGGGRGARQENIVSHNQDGMLSKVARVQLYMPTPATSQTIPDGNYRPGTS